MHAYVNILEDYNESGGSCFTFFHYLRCAHEKECLFHVVGLYSYVKIRESVCSFLVLHVSFFLQNNIIFCMLHEN